MSISNEEFENLHKTDQKITIFNADESYAKQYLSIARATNISLTSNIFLLYIFLSNNYLKTSPEMFLLVTGSNFLISLFLTFFTRRYSKDTLFAVYYMTKTRTFSTIYFDRGGTKEFELEPRHLTVIQESVSEFRKLQKELNDKNNANKKLKPSKIRAIYYDSKNKLPWKTVGAGKWYNTDLFLYLMTQSKSAVKDPKQVGKWNE